MNTLSFSWDAEKSFLNQLKHDGISFEEAQTVFYDEHARLLFDPDHSLDEDRFIILGFSLRRRLLIVCRCYREAESVIRIISARKASKREEESYGRRGSAG